MTMAQAMNEPIPASIAEPGTAQPERDNPLRDPAHAPLDDRDADGLLNSLRALAPALRHYTASAADTAPVPTGHWLPYLPAGTVAEAEAAADQVAPHHALLLAFLRQLARPQALLNQFTAEHLQFQMQRVLGFRPLPPQPDRAYLALALKKGAAPVEITPAHLFTAGKDASKVEQLFAPVRNSVVGHARVAQLACIRHSGPRLLFAPVANSADGLGAPLEAAAPRWPPFGHAALPAAPVGFAIASPLLRLAEGERRITLKLRVAGWPAGVSAGSFAAAFEAHLSGAAGWLDPLPVSASLSGDLLSLTVQLAAGLPAITDHDLAIHQHAFPAALPVLQCLLKADAALGYAPLAGITLSRARVVVQVRGMRELQLSSDEAELSPKKAFLPFGAQPVVGSRFHVGCAEALVKPLTALSIHLAWQGAPADLDAHYAHYAKRSQMSNGIGATVSWRDARGVAHTSSTVVLLPRRATPVTSIHLDDSGSVTASSPAERNRALHDSGSGVARVRAAQRERAQPVSRVGRADRQAVALGDRYGATPPASASTRQGVVTLSLVESLLHADFRRDALQAALPPADHTAGEPFVPIILNEPYTPKVQEITLDYSAQSDDSRLDDLAPAALTDTQLQFFQVDALGLSREHAWLNAQRPWAPQGAIHLLPPHPEAAALLIGLSGVQAGDSLSLLLQLAEGSADPLAAAQTLQWSVLADNAWRTLAPGELALDTTGQLRRSGLVVCVLPRETSTAHTRAPAGLVWLRATTPAEPRAACDVIGIHPNALEVQFADQGNDPQRLAAPLPAASITRLKTPLAPVKSIAQPYASFGGALIEDDAALARRASERLRHRNRAITPWDIERLVLQAFPAVYRAKCVPHASDSSWLAAGHLMVVVVPDLRQLNAVDPLRPRVDLDTLTRIREHLQARVGPQTQVHVRNPGYRAVQVDFKLRLRPGNGLGFNHLQPQIDQALRQALSPWAFDTQATLGFGGRVLRSALLDFVEDLPHVDFVTDFRLGLEGSGQDVPEIVPDAPDVILVSASRHRIAELRDQP